MITLTTDFGTIDPFVGVMKGVIATRAPGVPVVDITHGIAPHAVLAGALVLRYAVPYFPPGTIHVAVVDPGVGGDRRALCIETRLGLLVGPDNGLLAPAADAAGVVRGVELTDGRFFLHPRSATFHGRDVFAPVAAALATGTPVGALGPPCENWQRLDLPQPVIDGDVVRGEVVYVDRFGNLVTNIPAGLLPAAGGRVRLADLDIGPPAPTYAAVAPGAPVAVPGSFGTLEIAVRDGSAAGVLGHGLGAAVTVTPR